MIPRRLELRNFLSYRDCTVDLAGLHMAVLSGRNGDGKSALLDAMTWALWGKARGRLEDDRIHLGEADMLVKLDFAVGGDVFQVVRKRSRGRASGALELFLVEPGTRTALTGASVTETEREIVRRVRMDYDTFVNSAFIAQGRSNEFTRRTAADRKEIFRKVLGLERYEELSTAARDRRNAAAQDARSRDREVEDARRELEDLPGIEARLEEIADELAALLPGIEAAESIVAELRQAAAAFRQFEERAVEAQRRHAAVAKAIGESEALLCALEARRLDAERSLARRDEVTEAHARLEEARAAEQTLAGKQTQARTVEQEMAAAEQAIAAERARLEESLAGAEARLDAAHASADELPALREASAGLVAAREALSRFDGEISSFRDGEAAATGRAAELRSDAEYRRLAAAEIKEKQAALAGAEICPVCQANLTPADLARLDAEFSAERRSLGDRYRVALAEAEQAASDASDAHDAVQRLEGERSAADAALRREETAVAARLHAAEEAATALVAAEPECVQLRAILARERYAEDARTRFNDARGRLVACGYDADAHATLRSEIAGLAGVEEDYRAVAAAEAALQGILAQAAQGAKTLEGQRATEEQAAADVTAARDALGAAENVGPRLDTAEAALAERRQRKADLDREHGRCEQRRDQLRANHARVEMLRDAIRGLRAEELTYSDLQDAFGKNGAQAMLIDQALPRVQHTANAMLDRMTGGRIHVLLRTQRLTAAGNVTETLDIQISDDLGTRDYAMFSGGEAFRVDFALRIALAKLLSERAGATLPTLIIDEGFGSQDAEGIDRLVEALNAIQDEFELILVVTHIDELRDRFDRRIEVTKDPVRGSIARVL